MSLIFSDSNNLIFISSLLNWRPSNWRDFHWLTPLWILTHFRFTRYFAFPKQIFWLIVISRIFSRNTPASQGSAADNLGSEGSSTDALDFRGSKKSYRQSRSRVISSHFTFHFSGFQLFDWVSVCLHFLRRWLADSKIKTNLINLIGRFKCSVFRLVLNFEFPLNFGAKYWLEVLVQSNNDLFYWGWSIGLRELLNWKVSLTALLRICWQSEFTPNWAILSPPFCSVSPTFLSFQTANTTFCPPVTSTSFALKKPRPRLLTHAGFWIRWLTWRNLARLFTWLSIVSLPMSSTIV